MNDYEIVVEFNEDSKYINKDNFDLDHFEKISFEYEEKKEEPKKEDDLRKMPKKILQRRTIRTGG